MVPSAMRSMTSSSFCSLTSFGRLSSHCKSFARHVQAFDREWQDDLIGVARFVKACMNKMNPLPQGQVSGQPMWQI